MGKSKESDKKPGTGTTPEAPPNETPDPPPDPPPAPLPRIRRDITGPFNTPWNHRRWSVAVRRDRVHRVAPDRGPHAQSVTPGSGRWARTVCRRGV